MLDAINIKQIDFYESFIITTAVSIILENYLLCFTFTQIFEMCGAAAKIAFLNRFQNNGVKSCR